jgi:hypothetical protein
MNKKLLSKLLLLVAATLGFASVKAAPGDTTWVQANMIPQITYYGDYDTSVVFPDGSTSYRKIIMVYTLGQYNCPAGTQYCHAWDYTVTNFVITPTDTLELSRYITPYAPTGTPGFGPTWKQDYYFDVTDYYNQLKNNAIIRMSYSGYSWGFSANIKFAFIEGTRERDVLGIDKLWSGYFTYGDGANPIDNMVTAKSLQSPANTQFAELNMKISGHGADATTYCCEFNETDNGHDYFVKLNGAQIDMYNIWRDDCGRNEISPQGGTWIYNRANWCPGATVETVRHKLPGVTGASNHSLDVNFEAYLNTPSATNTGYGGYILEGQVFYYGDYNKNVDASLENIIAPNIDENFMNENPAGSRPTVRVRNTGKDPITSIKFSYGVKDSAVFTYTWTGNLNPSQTIDITFNDVPTLTAMSLDTVTGMYKFKVMIDQVNGVADADATNNSFISTFVAAPTWPTKIVISMKTNNMGVNGQGSGISETSWKIVDMYGNVFAQRNNCALSTTYNDTVSFAIGGFYRLVISDTGCDGLWWWPYTNTAVTSGDFAVREIGKPLGIKIPMNGYTYTGTYRHDFGCEFSQYFTTVSNPTGIVTMLPKAVLGMDVYPNPSSNQVMVQINDDENNSGTLIITNTIGQVVKTEAISNLQTVVDISKLSDGLYTFTYKNSKSEVVQQRLSVIK